MNVSSLLLVLAELLVLPGIGVIVVARCIDLALCRRHPLRILIDAITLGAVLMALLLALPATSAIIPSAIVPTFWGLVLIVLAALVVAFVRSRECAPPRSARSDAGAEGWRARRRRRLTSPPSVVDGTISLVLYAAFAAFALWAG